MNGFERRTREKQGRIMAAASRLFAVRGAAEVSVAEIAAEAGVSPASIYNYYGTKEGLTAALLEETIKRQLAEYEHWLSEGISFPELTSRLLAAEVEGLSLLAGMGGPTLDKAMATADRELERLVERYVDVGKMTGFIAGDLDVELVRAYLAMYRRELGRMLQEPQEQGRIEQWVRLFFYGLTGRDGGNRG